jgi:DNA modification methylase
MNIKDIRLNPDNPRFIKDDKFKKLCQSIKEFPKMLELRPIIVDSTGLILGGNMRFRAITQLGLELKDEWFKEASSLTDEEKRRFIIEDNVGFGEWDWDKLSAEFEKEEIEDWGLDIDKWKEDEIVEDEVPEVTENPVSKLGEVYQLGRHRIMCGDSTKIEDVEKLMDGKKADMVFTDPPYGMDLDTDYSKIKPNSDKARQFAKAKGETTNKNYRKVIGDDSEWIFDKANHFDCEEQFWWGADWYRRTLPQGGSWFVWDKRTNDDDSNLDKMFGSCFELCWSKTLHKRDIARIKYASLFGTEREDIKQRLHPTQKPILLAKWFFDRYGKDNDIVVDLFLGSGSTLIACEQTNRICYGMEIDPKYIDVIRKRYAKFIGQEEEWQEATPRI